MQSSKLCLDSRNISMPWTWSLPSERGSRSISHPKRAFSLQLLPCPLLVEEVAHSLCSAGGPLGKRPWIRLTNPVGATSNLAPIAGVCVSVSYPRSPWFVMEVTDFLPRVAHAARVTDRSKSYFPRLSGRGQKWIGLTQTFKKWEILVSSIFIGVLILLNLIVRILYVVWIKVFFFNIKYVFCKYILPLCGFSPYFLKGRIFKVKFIKHFMARAFCVLTNLCLNEGLKDFILFFSRSFIIFIHGV